MTHPVWIDIRFGSSRLVFRGMGSTESCVRSFPLGGPYFRETERNIKSEAQDDKKSPKSEWLSLERSGAVTIPGVGCVAEPWRC